MNATVDVEHIALQAHIDQLCAEWADQLNRVSA